MLLDIDDENTKIMHLVDFARYLRPRPRNLHKGECGHVLVVGGAPGFLGAARMSAEAALRVGAGLASVATHPDHASLLSASRPEIMSHAIHSVGQLDKLVERATIIVLGPGLGQDAWGKELYEAILQKDKPFVLDADGLNLLAKSPTKRENWILTPHPGEAARLLKKTSQEIQEDRITAVRALQESYGGIAVLKGADSLVMTSSDPLPSVCLDGNPGMATGGTGDVLTGVIAGLAAQGMPFDVAAKLGVLVHATAGDFAARKGGERGMLATDLMHYLRQVVN